MDNNQTISNRTPIINDTSSISPLNLGLTSGGVSMTQPVLRTPVGNVRPLAPPPLAPATSAASFNGINNYGMNNAYGFNNSYGNFGLTYGNGFGNNYGMYGGGLYNRFGNMNSMSYTDPESRFIHLMEASSRPAFESIESLVMVINNIASMLDSTFFALTSSFRAILGVAANISRIRNVFAQFWQTFTILRSLHWIYRKLLYWVRLSNVNPQSQAFRQAFAEAVNKTEVEMNGAPKLPRKNQSPWPILAFVSFIIGAPYLIMKLVGTVVTSVKEDALEPHKWINPIQTVALYDFQARNSSELNINAGDKISIAPKEIQNTLGLLNTGFAMATNGRQVGLIPINYVKSPQQMRQEGALSKSTKTLQESKPLDMESNDLETSDIK